MSFVNVLAAEHQLQGSVATRAEMYDHVCLAARRLLPVDAFYVCLYEPKNRRLRFEYNGDEDVLDPPEWFELGTGPTSRAIRTGKSHVLNHLHDDAMAPFAFGDTARRSRGAIHLPFWEGAPGATGGGAPRGVMSVQSYSLDAYDRSHVAAVRWLAARTAGLLRETEAQAALETARLAAAAEQRRRIDLVLDAHRVPLELRAALGAALDDPAKTLDTKVLTNRELQCLALAAQGLSYGRIADALGIGFETVKTYVPRSYAKVGLADGRTLIRHLPTLLAALAERGL